MKKLLTFADPDEFERRRLANQLVSIRGCWFVAIDAVATLNPIPEPEVVEDAIPAEQETPGNPDPDLA